MNFAIQSSYVERIYPISSLIIPIILLEQANRGSCFEYFRNEPGALDWIYKKRICATQPYK